jgi:transcriptional regulator
MPDELPEREQTIRQALRGALSEQTLTLRELSSLLGMPEKELAEQLDRLGPLLPRSGDRLEIEPACCLACGFQFEERRRAKRPSRCPQCKRERIRPAAFRIRAAGS